MQYTYIASDNTAANGVVIGAADQDIVIKKIIFGLPATTKNLYIYDKTNAVNGATTNIALRVTTPASLISGQLPYVLDLTSNDPEAEGQQNGLRLGEGATIITDGSQVTVLWELAE